MTDSQSNSLKWTAQLEVLPSITTPKLLGDKITLPQSSLVQLLNAATVTVPAASSLLGHSSTFDPFNPYTFDAERNARAQIFERQQNLPHPMIFRLVNPQNGNVAFAGIREFSADEGFVGISPFLREALGFEDHDPTIEEAVHIETESAKKLTIHACQLPKGTFVRFRPLEAGYDPEDWKSLLERHMRDTFTTLTKEEILSIPNGNERYRFLVDKIEPEGDGICIIDTDLEVDIEPLTEDQARESLKKKLAKNQRISGTSGGSSQGGELEIDGEQSGQVLPGEYVDYDLKSWDRSKELEIELDATDSNYAVDLLVSPLAPRQRARPRQHEYVFADITERPSKRLCIGHSNTEMEGAEALYVSVHGYLNDRRSVDEIVEPLGPLHYSLRVTSKTIGQSGQAPALGSMEESPPSPDEVRCKNCRQWVPQRTMMLHENFCYRNNVLCPQCQEVFKKSSPEWKDHWHCLHDNAHGNALASRQKHDHLFHTDQVCTTCEYQANNTPDLAHHRTTICPGKVILCQFCHLLVPQQGPDDASPSDPEVIFSGLTPHELADGARTTECHICGNITRLRDMSTHLKHHDLERLSRAAPRLCRNVNCGRTLDGVSPSGEIRRPKPITNDISLCDTCYGPLYNSFYDPEGKALMKRTERRYLSQLVTGCEKEWCCNEFCKTGRKHIMQSSETITMKDAMVLVKPILAHLMDGSGPLHFCTDEASQKRRVLAEMIAAEEGGEGYDLAWAIAALEAERGDLGRARNWLKTWAPTRAEAARR